MRLEQPLALPRNKPLFLLKFWQSIVTNKFYDQMFSHQIICLKTFVRVHLIGCWGVKLFLAKDCVKKILLQNLNCHNKIFLVLSQFLFLNFIKTFVSDFCCYLSYWVWSFITMWVCSVVLIWFFFFCHNLSWVLLLF